MKDTNIIPLELEADDKKPRKLVRVAPYLYRSESGSYYCRRRLQGRLHLSKSLGTDFKIAKFKAEDWWRQLKHNAAQVETNDPRKGHLKTFADCRDAFLAETDYAIATRQLSPASKSYREQRLKHLLYTWADANEMDLLTQPVDRITAQQCKVWAAHFAQKFNPITFNNTIAVLKAVLQQAVQGGRLLNNPAQGLKRMGIPHKAQRIPSPEEFKLVVQQMRDGVSVGKDGKTYPSKAGRNADLAQLLAFTLSRLHEIAYHLPHKGGTGKGGRPKGTSQQRMGGLRWQDILWETRQVRVWRAKAHMKRHGTTKTEQLFPMWQPLEDLLRRLKEENPHAGPDDLVVDCPECLPQLCKAVTELKKAGKLPGDFPDKLDHHDLRKMGATWMLTWGMPIPLIARLLGHRDNGVTLLKSYAHVCTPQDDELLAEAGSKLLAAA
jgi:integrase